MQDCAQALESESNEAAKKMCKSCKLQKSGYGQASCKKHGYEFVDWKCMRCCSMAVFFCGGGSYTFCTPCHNDAMAGKHTITSTCEGGPNCPLGIPFHPKASTETTSCFPMGCSICRSENLELIETNNDSSAFVNLENRKDMKARFGKVLGHALNHEMQRFVQAHEQVRESPEEREARIKRERQAEA